QRKAELPRTKTIHGAPRSFAQDDEPADLPHDTAAIVKRLAAGNNKDRSAVCSAANAHVAATPQFGALASSMQRPSCPVPMATRRRQKIANSSRLRRNYSSVQVLNGAATSAPDSLFGKLVDRTWRSRKSSTASL